MLKNKQTACLAADACGMPAEVPKENYQNRIARVAPNSECC
ncbi:MAG: DUF6428 family protein [Sphingobacterium sp.]